MNGPKPTEVAQIATLGALQAALPALEQVVETDLKAIDNRVFQLIDAGALTAQEAIIHWTSRRYLKKFVSRLQGKNASIQDLGEKLKPFLDQKGQ